MDDRADSGGDTTGLRDIDEKVLARHALEASERRYRLLAENATDSVFLVDPSGVLTWVSPATEKVLGYPPQDLLGTRTVDLVHPEDLPEMLARRARAANGETGVPFEVRVRNVSGAFRWMSGSSSNVEDGDGTVIGRISTMRDVHEQVLAREQLNAERARLRATLDSLLDPHVLLEAVRDGSGEIVDFVYTDANPAACTYNGLAYRDLMGARLLELLPGHVASGLLDQYQHVVQTGEPLALNDFVYAQELLGGVQRYYDIRAARVGDGLSYTWRDVTHRHDAVEALAAAEHRFRLLAENASDIVWRLDGDAIISWVSPSVESVLGWTPDQVVGTSPRELTHPDDLDLLLKRWAGTTSDRTPAPFEIRARAADGGYRWMSIRVRPTTGADGAVTGAIVGFRDIQDEVAARHELAASESRYRGLVDALPDATYVFRAVRDDDGAVVDLTYTHINLAAAVSYQRAPQDMLGQTLLTLFPGLESLGVFDFCTNTLITRQPGYLRVPSFDVNGAKTAFDLTAVPFGDEVLVTARDITAALAAKQALAAAEQQYRLLAENATDIVWQLDADGVLVWVTPSVESVLGWAPEQLVGTDPADLVHPDDRRVLDLRRASAYSGETVVPFELRLRTAGGDYRWISGQSRSTIGADGAVDSVVAGLRDVHDEVSARTALSHALEHDPLTGLATLSVAAARIDQLLDELSRSGRPGRTVGVLCVGVDSLKTVNEALTHTAGDRVMMAIAFRVASIVTNPDLLARGSGDEFIVLLPDLVSGADASVIAEQIRRAVHGTVTIGTHHVEPTVSIGIATGRPGAHGVELVRDAALAMHRAKDNGRDRFEFFQTRLAVEAQHRLSVEDDLRQGLGQGQFVPWFQPVVNLDDGAVIGYEALVRWVRPDGSVVTPDNFIPVAERTSLITELDLAVLRQSVQMLGRLPAPMVVAVNVSAPTLAHADFARWVITELTSSQVDPTRLHVEFTETELLNISERVRGTMGELADFGVRWYVDDFGTGYSSISHLRDLPIAGLKLDLSFTAGIAVGDPRCEQLATALVGLASTLGLDTVAEGVETPEVATVLRAQGWKHAQGWLYGHAEPAAAKLPS